MEFSESFSQFAESSLFRVQLDRSARGTCGSCRSQTLAYSTTPSWTFSSLSFPVLTEPIAAASREHSSQPQSLCIGKVWKTVCCILDIFGCVCLSKNRVQIGVSVRQSVSICRNDSTYFTQFDVRNRTATSVLPDHDQDVLG